ncbi:MAG: hypothetical protein JNM27_20105 [Leptospirales bacterium]|nr:hypothetical protein [Leptospirales bacterium]
MKWKIFLGAVSGLPIHVLFFPIIRENIFLCALIVSAVAGGILSLFERRHWFSSLWDRLLLWFGFTMSVLQFNAIAFVDRRLLGPPNENAMYWVNELLTIAVCAIVSWGIYVSILRRSKKGIS